MDLVEARQEIVRQRAGNMAIATQLRAQRTITNEWQTRGQRAEAQVQTLQAEVERLRERERVSSLGCDHTVTMETNIARAESAETLAKVRDEPRDFGKDRSARSVTRSRIVLCERIMREGRVGVQFHGPVVDEWNEDFHKKVCEVKLCSRCQWR